MTYDSIKNVLLDPDSMIVYDCYGWGTQSEELEKKEYEENRSAETEVELPDDQYAIYFYVGAKNKLGGISDEEYLFLYDAEGNLIDAATGSDYEAMVDGDSSITMNHDLHGQFLNVTFWNMFDDWEYAEDYIVLIDSEEFDKIDYKKILSE